MLVFSKFALHIVLESVSRLLIFVWLIRFCVRIVSVKRRSALPLAFYKLLSVPPGTAI